jgi:hypothetical protein
MLPRKKIIFEGQHFMGLQFLELILNFIIFLRKAILRDYIN